jgi:uncharacterized protein (TIGR02231 family)
MAQRTLSELVLVGAISLVVAGCAQTGTLTGSPQEPGSPEGSRPAISELPEAFDARALESSAATLASKVTKVTVYSDRARVTRSARAEVSTEPTVVAFRNLPGWVDDGSVRVAASAGRIVDVRVERDFLARASDESVQRAEAKHQTLASQMAALDDELKVLDAQKAQIESIKAFSLEKITKDTTIGDVSVDTYGDVLTFISESLRETAKARRSVQLQREKLAPELQASLLDLNEKNSLTQLEETTVLVTLQSREVTPSEIELTYMMPGATWEPMHELRVSTTDSRDVEVISFAMVTQTSGEDWGSAELSFSTQSSTQSVRIPELEALTLGDTHTATRILTSKMSSFTRAQQAFEGQSELWNKVHQRSSTSERLNFEKVYKSNIEELHVVQGKTVQIFESLQKRGTTAHFKANASPGVRGDGHPVRMRIGSSTLESKQKIVAVPEQSLNAARTLDMSNSTGQALLPGKVALYQDGAFLGMTGIDFVAKGESFSLFLGVADQLKLSRELDRKRSTLIRRKRNRMEVSFIVKVENLSDEAARLSLADRIPVSENKDIRVDKVKISPNVRPDSQGLLHWDLTMKPKEVREYRISYQVEYPSALVIEAQRRRMIEAAADAPAAARPAKRKKYRIEEQLMDLEAHF